MTLRVGFPSVAVSFWVLQSNTSLLCSCKHQPLSQKGNWSGCGLQASGAGVTCGVTYGITYGVTCGVTYGVTCGVPGIPLLVLELLCNSIVSSMSTKC